MRRMRTATPAAADAALFSDYVYYGRGVLETDLSDKPLWVRDPTVPYRQKCRSPLSLPSNLDPAGGRSHCQGHHRQACGAQQAQQHSDRVFIGQRLHVGRAWYLAKNA